MTTSQRFPGRELELLEHARILGVRSGSDHRFTGVWVVVVEGRVFVRSWGDKPTGWYRAFRTEPYGKIAVGKEELAIRARHVRSMQLREAVTQAYAGKYKTTGSRRLDRCR